VEGLKVLDVCTGTGEVALALARAGAAVTGVDLSGDMLRQAKRKTGADAIRFLKMDATHLMFNPDEFDSATVSWGLHEMPLEIIRRVLQEIHRVTKRRLVVFDYRQPSSGVLRGLYRFIVGLYEGPFCMAFLDTDLAKVAREAGFELESERIVMAGTCKLLSFRVVKQGR
jgi:ubiquinone/menaquinone biosynthesis C-methylase UbiE